MTRLTLAPTGNPLTFKPVTSSYVRNSKDGNIDIVSLLFGTHYNIAFEGILDNTTTGDIAGASIAVVNSVLEMEGRTTGATEGENIATYTTYGYMYPGLKVKGSLEISETTHSSPAPKLECYYKIIDKITFDEIKFVLTRTTSRAVFKLIQVVSGEEEILLSKTLDAGVARVDFEFWYKVNGRSRLYFFNNFGFSNQSKTRKWIGNIDSVVGEVEVSARFINDENVLKKFKSDFLFFKYFNIDLRYDNDLSKQFNGQIIFFDDINEADEAKWIRVRSRDHNFIGNRVIENAMIRIIIKTSSPVIEIWGYDFVIDNAWEKVMEILTESDLDVSSNLVRSFIIEYFNKEQIKFIVDFGTSKFQIMMGRGNPNISVLNTTNKIIRFKSDKTRFALDVPTGDYSLANTWIDGSPVVRAAADETITVNSPSGFEPTGFTATGFVISAAVIDDNYFAMYKRVPDDIVGWISNLRAPNTIKIIDQAPDLKFEFSYQDRGNLWAIGVLPSTPSILVGGIPTPLVVVATQDVYVKWRANEGLFAFKKTQTIRKKQL